MIGIIDTGGGLRGIYGAGVFDRCLDERIKFDYCIGVSAGSANLASYLAKQKGRNYLFYTEYSFSPEYMSFSNWIKTGSYLSVEHVYATLSNEGGKNPLNFEKLSEFDGEFYIVATEAKSGKCVYFKKDDLHKNDYKPFMASSCLPIACKPCVIDDTEYFDGGISNPIPIEKALEDGCDKLVILLTKPRTKTDASNLDRNAEKVLRKKYPNIARCLREKHEIYINSLKLAEEYEKEGKVLIVSPNNLDGMKTLTKDKEKMDNLYRKGYIDAKRIIDFLER